MVVFVELRYKYVNWTNQGSPAQLTHIDIW